MNKLDAWMTENGRQTAELAEFLGCAYETARRYRTGERYPERINAVRIVEFTDGALTIDDLYGVRPQPTKCSGKHAKSASKNPAKCSVNHSNPLKRSNLNREAVTACV